VIHPCRRFALSHIFGDAGRFAIDKGASLGFLGVAIEPEFITSQCRVHVVFIAVDVTTEIVRTGSDLR